VNTVALPKHQVNRSFVSVPLPMLRERGSVLVVWLAALAGHRSTAAIVARTGFSARCVRAARATIRTLPPMVGAWARLPVGLVQRLGDAEAVRTWLAREHVAWRHRTRPGAPAPSVAELLGVNRQNAWARLRRLDALLAELDAQAEAARIETRCGTNRDTPSSLVKINELSRKRLAPLGSPGDSPVENRPDLDERERSEGERASALVCDVTMRRVSLHVVTAQLPQRASPRPRWATRGRSATYLARRDADEFDPVAAASARKVGW
jgi:hypothetical protein